MRSMIDINGALLRRALKASGLANKSAVIEEGLRLLLKVKGQVGIRRLRGRMRFEGNARGSREDEK